METTKLVITEKPSVALAYAGVIGAGSKKDGYYEGNDYIVSWCFGHLVQLFSPDDYSDKWSGYWKIEQLPMIPDVWKTKTIKSTAAQFKILKKLMERNDVDSIIEATDAGREGELIFRLVYDKSGCDKPFMRLWISSMEEKAIKDGFNNLKPGNEYDNLYGSATCRLKADWLIGMNGTRLYSCKYGNKLTVGRVQSPTLAMIVDRENEINTFVKSEYYRVHIEKDGIEGTVDKIEDKKMANDIAAKCNGADAFVSSVVDEIKEYKAPLLYDLTSLQRDANKIFGFTAKKTLDIAQSLYEKKLITYPRTDARFLTDDMEESVLQLIELLKSESEYGNLVSGVVTRPLLNSKKVSDHHALIPTMQYSREKAEKLTRDEQKVLELICVRLLTASAESLMKRHISGVLCASGNDFKCNGVSIEKNGWMEIQNSFNKKYKVKNEDDNKPIPKIQEGDVLKSVESKVTVHYTKPKPHYTENSLLRAMETAGATEMDDEVERKGLGTPATRADIIEKLVQNGYLTRQGGQLIPTSIGCNLIKVLPDRLKSPLLTAEWENNLVQVGRGEMKASFFMSKIETEVKDMVNDEKGASGGNPFDSVICKCPNCGGDVVVADGRIRCKDSCGMTFKYYGAEQTADEIVALVEGKKILKKGLKSKSGHKYNAYVWQEGIKAFSFTNSKGEEVNGFSFDYKFEYENKEKKND